MIHKHKNNSQSNWALVNKLFPIAYERWERFRKSADECHMNWTRDRWRGAKTHEILLEQYRRKSFLHRIVTGNEKWIFFENPKRKKSWVDPGAPSISTARPNRFDRKTMLCVWWDQKGVAYYELLKPGETVNTNAINNNCSIWTVRCLKNDQNTKRDNTRSFFSMTMLHHIRQNQFGTCWKHSAGKFYPMRLTHQTWLLPITTCLHRWSHLLSSALVRTKMWKNDSMNGSRQKEKIFTSVISTNCPKDEKKNV